MGYIYYICDINLKEGTLHDEIYDCSVEAC